MGGVGEAEGQGTLSAGDENEYSGDEDDEDFDAAWIQLERDLRAGVGEC